MGVLGRRGDDHYMPDSGILVVLDVRDSMDHEETSDNEAHPVGSIGRSGNGWLYVAGGDGPCVVQLQAHDDPPSDEGLDAWADLVEVPYQSPSGTVALSDLMGGPGEDHLKLGDPGLYRVRLAHRPLPPTPPPDDEDDLQPTDVWHLDFWPVTDVAEPPRWIRRSRPPVWAPDPGWGSVLGFQEIEVANVIEWFGRPDGLRVDEIDAWGADHHRGADWLDQPLRQGPPSRPEWPSLAELAGQVDVPEPTTRRELLPLYIALRMVSFDGLRYRAVEHPPSAEDVVQLPAQAVTFLKASRAVKQYTGYAADIVSVALWGGTEQTVASLAERTCASEDDVRATLEYAESRGLLQIDRTGDNLSLTVRTRRHAR
ncbi:DUF6042 family protein [Kribbella sp. CA-245084]|uniref:DUF6042 family protein n=1 Tax=Kribbella sp. CA-245084 TaxID=3239940 RepID=UPI003D8DBB98